MNFLADFVFFFLIFLSLYAQVFFLVTFIENKAKLKIAKKVLLKRYPSVTIIVPCWNEELTVEKTLLSLINLNYPKNKLEIFVVDDGSTDKTWEVISKFTNYENIKIFKKENGGKHTALNFGIENSKSEFIGCLDADSEADKDSLIKIMQHFEENKELMSVCPSIVVKNAKTRIQKAQIAEYYMSIYIKKMFSFFDGIHVTPGPLSIFKKEVFDKIGLYKGAHGTEDMEIAYRMQVNHLKIGQCHDAYVYTNTPDTLKKLFKQRLRWTYGFINNTLDYRSAILNRQYGNFSIFTLPFFIVAVLTLIYMLLRIVFNLFEFLFDKITYLKTLGLDFDFNYGFDWFYVNTNISLLITFFFYFAVIFSVYTGRYMSKDKKFPFINFVYFLFVFSILAPLYLLKAIYNTILAKKPMWR